MIWKTWDDEWILQMVCVAIFDIIHSQRIYEMLLSTIVMENNKMEEEYVSSSSTFALLVKKEVILITFIDYKKEFG